MIAARRTARLLATLALTLAPVVLIADPAAAVACSIRLDGMLAEATIGVGYEFGAVVVNDAVDPAVGALRVRLHVTLSGLGTDQIQVERRDPTGGWGVLADKTTSDGDIKAVDHDVALSGASFTGRYRLTLTPGAPTGTAVITATALASVDGSWTAAGKSPRYVVTVAPSGTAGRRDAVRTPAVAGSGSSDAPAQPSPGPSASGAGPNTALAGAAGPVTAPESSPTGTADTTPEPSAMMVEPARYRSPAMIVAITLTAIALLTTLSWLLWRRIARPPGPPPDAPTA